MTFASTMSSMNLALILLLSYFFTYLGSFPSTWTSTLPSLPMRKESRMESYVLAFLAFSRGVSTCLKPNISSVIVPRWV